MKKKLKHESFFFLNSIETTDFVCQNFIFLHNLLMDQQKHKQE